MGDTYNFHGPVGAGGRDAQGTVNIGAPAFNLVQLHGELQTLGERLRARDPEDPDLIIVEEAAIAANQGEAQVVEGKLRWLSRRALEASKEVGLAVASAAIIHYAGFGG